MATSGPFTRTFIQWWQRLPCQPAHWTNYANQSIPRYFMLSHSHTYGKTNGSNLGFSLLPTGTSTCSWGWKPKSPQSTIWMQFIQAILQQTKLSVLIIDTVISPHFILKRTHPVSPQCWGSKARNWRSRLPVAQTHVPLHHQRRCTLGDLLCRFLLKGEYCDLPWNRKLMSLHCAQICSKRYVIWLESHPEDMNTPLISYSHCAT